jgi:8-oxo-dGTP diphosphatase
MTYDEKTFLESYNPNDFERPSVAVDLVILTLDKRLKALLVKRTESPFKNSWALPGGFVGIEESLEQAALRVLEQKAALKQIYLEQLYSFGAVKRDPRMRIISVAYFALLEASQLREHEGWALFEVVVPWQGEAGGAVSIQDKAGKIHSLAFDHNEILGMAVKRLRGKLEYVPLGFELLPKRFTLRELQGVHETILGRSLNKDAFRRKMLASKMLEAEELFKGHFGANYFPKAAWLKVVDAYGGLPPVKIRAVPEDMVIPTHNVLVTVESGDEDLFWLPSWLEIYIPIRLEQSKYACI